MAYSYHTPQEQVIQENDIQELQNELIKKRLESQKLNRNYIKDENTRFIDELFKFEFNEESLKLILVAGPDEDAFGTPVDYDCFSNLDNNQLFTSDISFDESDPETHLEFSDKYKRCIHSTPTPKAAYKSDNRKCSISSDLSVDTLITKNTFDSSFGCNLQSYATRHNKRNFESFWQGYGHDEQLVTSPSNILKKRKLRSVSSNTMEDVPRLQSPIMFNKKSIKQNASQ